MFEKYFQKRRADKELREAVDLESEHKYQQAAEVWAERAKLKHDGEDENELLFADDCISSFKDWIKAGNGEEALNQARRALQGYLVGDWLDPENDDEGENITSLKNMVADLRQAGFLKEADALLGDINNALQKLGQQPMSVMVVTTEYRFPDSCPHCGGSIDYCGHLDEIACPFCNGRVHALSTAN